MSGWESSCLALAQGSLKTVKGSLTLPCIRRATVHSCATVRSVFIQYDTRGKLCRTSGIRQKNHLLYKFDKVAIKQ